MTDDTNTKLQKWGEGPWVEEPDRLEFYAHGLPCLMRRNERLGNWCGYAAVPPGHPLHGADHNDERLSDIYAHGGITYADACHGEICHRAQPGEADDVWWFGFDCGHAGDLMPWMLRDLGEDAARLIRHDVYRDEAYVRAECERLAEQLTAAAGRAP